MSGRVLAVVGSRRFANLDAYTLILTHLVAAVAELEPVRLVSGGAPGADRFAAAWARSIGLPVTEHLPAHPRWEPDGYRDRNLVIVGDCTHLLSLRCAAATSYGSGWTADRAEEAGRLVRRVLIPAS